MEEAVNNCIGWIMENFNIMMYSFLIMYITKLKCKDYDSGKCNKFCERIAQRDFRYTVFILGLIIVLLSTSKFASNDNLFNYVSFASSISSLILSLIAIVMSINSESKMDVVKSSLDTSLDKLAKFSKTLDDNMKEFNELIVTSKDNLSQINKEINEREEIVKSTLTSLGDKLSNIVQDINKNTIDKKIDNRINVTPSKNVNDIQNEGE